MAEVVGDDFHEGKIDFLRVLGVSFWQVKTNEEVADHREIFDMMYIKILYLKRPLIFLCKNGFMYFIAMLIEATSCRPCECQELIVDFIIDDISNVD